MYNLSKYHARCVCSECNKQKTLFVPHPQDAKKHICADCAKGKK